jgi:OmpA-OmpF porin, OOP family
MTHDISALCNTCGATQRPRAPKTLLLSALALLMTACSTPVNRVLLLPQPGVPGAVVVSTAAGQSTLNLPYAATEFGRDGVQQPVRSSAAEVRARYPQLLALQPAPAERYTLRFALGTSDLTEESAAQLDTIIRAARARPGGEILIIGHTDRQGSVEANDALSLRRSTAIRDLLVTRGFAAELIEASGRGERDPLVPTDDDVPEPRNRRAEVVVR